MPYQSDWTEDRQVGIMLTVISDLQEVMNIFEITLYFIAEKPWMIGVGNICWADVQMSCWEAQQRL